MRRGLEDVYISHEVVVAGVVGAGQWGRPGSSAVEYQSGALHTTYTQRRTAHPPPRRSATVAGSPAADGQKRYYASEP